MKLIELINKYNHSNVNRFFKFIYSNIYMDIDVDNKTLELFNNNIDKILNNYPIEYILNKAYFYKLELYVNDNVLIPRDETEELVEWILNDNPNPNLKVLDMCSGSGCIGLSLKVNKPTWNIDLVDISKEALDVSKINFDNYKMSANFIESNMFNNYQNDFDILVSNPPYIAKNDKEVAKAVLDYEPNIALFTNDSLGIEYYQIMFKELNTRNFKYAYFEIGYNQKEALIKELNNYDFNYEFKKDISNLDRMLKVWKK